MTDWRICDATGRDMEDVRALLRESALLTDDIEASQPAFIVAIQDSTIVGVGGFEQFGEIGLLRSVAVRASHRRTGLGREIVQQLEKRAWKSGVTELVLLTETARAFFQRQGYGLIDRQAAPPAVQDSSQFKSLCPQSASCMFKPLRPTASQGRT